MIKQKIKEDLDIVLGDLYDAACTLSEGERIHWDEDCYTAMATILENVKKYVDVLNES